MTRDQNLHELLNRLRTCRNSGEMNDQFENKEPPVRPVQVEGHRPITLAPLAAGAAADDTRHLRSYPERFDPRNHPLSLHSFRTTSGDKKPPDHRPIKEFDLRSMTAVPAALTEPLLLPKSRVFQPTKSAEENAGGRIEQQRMALQERERLTQRRLELIAAMERLDKQLQFRNQEREKIELSVQDNASIDDCSTIADFLGGDNDFGVKVSPQNKLEQAEEGGHSPGLPNDAAQGHHFRSPWVSGGNRDDTWGHELLQLQVANTAQDFLNRNRPKQDQRFSGDGGGVDHFVQV